MSRQAQDNKGKVIAWPPKFNTANSIKPNKEISSDNSIGKGIYNKTKNLISTGTNAERQHGWDVRRG